MITMCKNCEYWRAGKPYTPEEEGETRRNLMRAQGENYDPDKPLPERPGTCHRVPPKCEVIPTMMGPTNITVWPQTHRDDPDACCGDGVPKE